MQQDLDQLELIAADSDAPKWARSRAEIACALCEQQQGGGLDEWEFAELMQRLTGPELDREADDLELKARLISHTLGAANLI